MLDDASYNSDAAATAGTVALSSPDLTWSGDLAAGASATVTYSVTVHNPDTGSHVLTNTITSATAGNNCPAGGTDPRCAVTIDVSALTIVNTASVTTTTPGSTVTYTVTVTNTGQTPYTGVSVTDPLPGVLDDAAYNNDATASRRLGHLHQPQPDLDREPGPRRRRDHHLLRHREQPRHRRQVPHHAPSPPPPPGTTARPAAPTPAAPPRSTS